MGACGGRGACRYQRRGSLIIVRVLFRLLPEIAAVRAVQPIWGSLRRDENGRSPRRAAAVLSYLDHAQQNKTHGAWLGTTPRYRTRRPRDATGRHRAWSDYGLLLRCNTGAGPRLLCGMYDLPLYHSQNYGLYCGTSAARELFIERASIWRVVWRRRRAACGLGTLRVRRSAGAALVARKN